MRLESRDRLTDRASRALLYVKPTQRSFPEWRTAFEWRDTPRQLDARKRHNRAEHYFNAHVIRTGEQKNLIESG